MTAQPEPINAEIGKTPDPYHKFHRELESLINRHSLENRTDTPDFILADYVVECLRALEHQHRAKVAWSAPLGDETDDT